MRNKTCAFVQARMGSVRLPGKSLMKPGGRELILWVLDGAAAAQRVDQVVLLTGDDPQNDPLARVAGDAGYAVFRGSESDVLGRFIAASQAHPCDWIVRICADNPFLNGFEIDRLIQFFEERQSGTNRVDYAFNNVPADSNNYPDGLGAEIFRAQDLKDVDRLATVAEREHVTLVFKRRPERFAAATFAAPENIADPGIKLDIDTPADFERISGFMEYLTQQGVDFQDAPCVCAAYREYFKT